MSLTYILQQNKFDCCLKIEIILQLNVASQCCYSDARNHYKWLVCCSEATSDWAQSDSMNLRAKLYYYRVSQSRLL